MIAREDLMTIALEVAEDILSNVEYSQVWAQGPDGEDLTDGEVEEIVRMILDDVKVVER